MSTFDRRRRRIDDSDDSDSDEGPATSRPRFLGEDDEEQAVADPVVYEEEEDGEDLLENAEQDYQRIDALDHYGTEGIDDTVYDAIDVDQRRAAERELASRSNRNDGFYGALDVEDDEDEEARQARRGGFLAAQQQQDSEAEEAEEEEEEDLDGADPVNLGAFDVPLREWIAQSRTRREIQRRFRSFLRHFTPNGDLEQRKGNGIYEQSIRSMCASNLCALEIEYVHLFEAQPYIASWLVDAPKDILGVLNEAATRHTLALFPSYTAIQTEIHVRISEFPIVNSLRDLRRSHLDSMVKVHGVVTRRSAVSPQLSIAYYKCTQCPQIQGPIYIDPDQPAPAPPDSCGRCENPRPLRLHPTMSLYRNTQRLKLQETPGSVPAGRVPRSVTVIVADDLVDAARPGEPVRVTGVYTASQQQQHQQYFPVFGTSLTANHVQAQQESQSLSANDIQQILELSRDPRIADRIIRSLAPSLHGVRHAKHALALSLFGGVPKSVNDKHRIRGDVNVLLLGDPGKAFSFDTLRQL